MVTARTWSMKKEQWVHVKFESMEDLEEDVAQFGTLYYNVKEDAVDRKTGSTRT